MRIIFHTQYYPPEVGAPQARLSELARLLSELGVQVIILTAMPNYPMGTVLPGYRAFFRKEMDGNVIIYRCGILPTLKTAIIPRLISYFSFVFSSLVIGLFCLPKSDFLLTESPPLFLGLSGFVLSSIKKARWIFNVADLWPASAVELGVIRENSLSQKIGTELERFLYNRAWLITGQSKSILADILRRFPNKNVYHLSNGAMTQNYIHLQSMPVHSKTRIVYAGLHGLAQGIDQILQAAKTLEDNDEIEFLLVGDGPEKQKLIQMATEMNLKNIRFLEPILKNEIPQLLESADIILVPLKIQLTGAVPSKLYEAMASARPVILIAEQEAANIVNEAKCGVVVKPGDQNGLVNGINLLYNDPELRREMGKNGRVSAINNFDRKKIAETFVEFLKSNFPNQ